MKMTRKVFRAQIKFLLGQLKIGEHLGDLATEISSPYSHAEALITLCNFLIGNAVDNNWRINRIPTFGEVIAECDPYSIVAQTYWGIVFSAVLEHKDASEQWIFEKFGEAAAAEFLSFINNEDIVYEKSKMFLGRH